MPWCHTCRVEYAAGEAVCEECGGSLVAAPAPERRAAAAASAGLRVVATLPAPEALVASGRLDDRGIPASLRRSDLDAAEPEFHVLVAEERLADARGVLRRERRAADPAHTRTMTAIALVTAIALALSAATLAVRWLLSGSPLPR